MSLLEDARLTDEERDGLFRTKIVTDGTLQREPVLERLFSNAATAKALWAAVDFLHEWVNGDALKLKYPADVTLANACAAAGIERPKEALHED